MRKLRLTLKILGIIFAIIGISNSSCKKDDDDECVTCTIDADYTDSGDTEKYTYCKDDKSEWEDEFDSWSDLVDEAKEMDANYEFISCKF